MEIKIKVNENSPSLFERITLVLIGIFITSYIFAIFTKYFGKPGIWFGLIIIAILIFCGFYYGEKGKKLRMITWGIVGTLIIIATILTAGIIYISDFLEKFLM